jgi:hypothetical protein
MTTRTRRRVSFTSAATAVVVVAGLIGLVVLFGPGHGPFSPRQVSPTAQAGGPNGHKPSPSPGGQPARLKGCVDPVTANPNIRYSFTSGLPTQPMDYSHHRAPEPGCWQIDGFYYPGAVISVRANTTNGKQASCWIWVGGDQKDHQNSYKTILDAWCMYPRK